MQGNYESIYYSEEMFSSVEVDKQIIVNDRGTVVSFMYGLNAYTISSGIFPRYLHGDNIIAIPLESDKQMHIGYIFNKNQEISEIGIDYIEELMKYAPKN